MFAVTVKMNHWHRSFKTKQKLIFKGMCLVSFHKNKVFQVTTFLNFSWQILPDNGIDVRPKMKVSIYATYFPTSIVFSKWSHEEHLAGKGFSLCQPKYIEGLNNLSKAVNAYALMYSFNTNALQGERTNPWLFFQAQTFYHRKISRQEAKMPVLKEKIRVF